MENVIKTIKNMQTTANILRCDDIAYECSKLLKADHIDMEKYNSLKQQLVYIAESRRREMVKILDLLLD